MPENFDKWASLNQDRIARAEQRGTLPYFVRDNRERVKQAVKQGDVMRANKMSYSGGQVLQQDIMPTIQEKNKLISQINATSKKVNLFEGNLQFEFDTNPSSGTIMAFKNGNTLVVSQKSFLMEDGSEFVPFRSLSSALTKLKDKQTLSFHEEYMVETLFHESLHSKAVHLKNKINIERYSPREDVLEACTQLYARNNYVKIMRSYGVEPVNFAKIQTDGYGYKGKVDMLRTIFTKNGELQVGELINIANETTDGLEYIKNKLDRLYGIEARKLFFYKFRYA